MAGKVSNAKAPAHTFEEGHYLKHLIDGQIPVRVRLADGQELDGTIEFYDACFLRLTRLSEPNVFVYKHEIKYLVELDQGETAQREPGQ